jgi:cellobiose-specific phosphotransferase system component IIB
MKIKDLLNEDVKGLLSEESLTAIQNAFDGKVQIAIEQALENQDEVYAEKLQKLVKSIDQDHTQKMRRIMESVDKNRSNKLVKIVKLYERDLKNDGSKFKKALMGNLSSYLDEYLEECVSKEDIQAAVRNKTSYTVLENLRNVLAIDTVAQNKVIHKAVVEGKSKLTELQRENAELKKNFKLLYESNETVKKSLFLENKLSNVGSDKKAFIKKALDNKPLDFIEENFEYVSRLFDKAEKGKLKVIKEEAIENRKVKPDFVKTPEKVVNESVNNNDDETDPYVSVLSQVRKFS